jgi:hypothetical protein
MEKEKRPQQPLAPVYNAILPNNPYGHFQLDLRDPFSPVPTPVQAPPNNTYGHFQPTLRDPFPPIPTPVQSPLPSMGLIPGTHSEGPKMDIASFCHMYALPEVVLQHFQEHAISGTHAFSYISSGDLTGIGFRLGEIIDLKEAIRVWATPKPHV